MANGIDALSALDNSHIPLSGGLRENIAADSTFSRLLEREQEQLHNAAAAAPDSDAPSTVPGKVTIDKEDKLYEQCLALETFIMKTILSGMRKNVMKSDLLDTGYAGEVYEDMLWDEYAKEYTKGAELGLADLAYLELTGQRGKLM
jgi:flagellar protein FlgJ